MNSPVTMRNNSTARFSARFRAHSRRRFLPDADVSIPALTIGALLICTIIFIDSLASNASSIETLPGFAAHSGESWSGLFAALITSVFVHVAIWHFGFNMYWLWILGRRLEEALGWWRYAMFFLLAAIISSFAQFLVSGHTGIGASGVIYAMFGFMWIARYRFTDFQKVADNRIFGFFAISLVMGIILTTSGAANIGNTAHVSGGLFGIAIAYIYKLNGRAAWDTEEQGESDEQEPMG